ncbi:MAG: ribonuclease HIII [Akkermansia sp.]|nr:ribonuclease HIII [Akkermansia sp.]
MANQHTVQLSPAEAKALRNKLAERAGYEESKREYADFCFEGPRVNVAYYPKKGRLLVQGAGADEFLEFVMLIDPSSGISTATGKPATPAAMAQAKMTAALDESPHFGVDESGKGDYFGPLVIAGVYSDEKTAAQLVKLGCRDSKAISDDRKIAAIAAKVMALPGVAYEVVCIGPRRYNELYTEFGNLNRLLAWGHARVIAALHEKVPTCARALSDKFANEWVLRMALKKRNVPIRLDQRTKAESDIAVAAASILARARFVKWMQEASAASGCELPLGCAPHVTKAARAFVAAHGSGRLQDVAKLHFKTTSKVLS